MNYKACGILTVFLTSLFLSPQILAQTPELYDNGIDLEKIRTLYNTNMKEYSQIGDMFANERINIYLDEMVIGVVTANGEITEIQEGEISDPTVKIYSDKATVEGIVGGEISIIQALKDGRITYEGVGFFNMLKFAFASFLFNLWVMFGGG